MATIDIWPWAVNRSGTYSITGLTVIDKNNPANGDWIITDIEIYLTGTVNVNVAIFEPLWWTSYKTRSYVSLWNVARWKQTFTWLNLTVKTWDVIWIYGASSGSIERSTIGYINVESVTGDKTAVGTEFDTTSSHAWDAISIYWYWTTEEMFIPVIIQF